MVVSSQATPYRAYQRLVTFWTVVFAIAGLYFMFLPGRLAADLDMFAGLLGLEGQVPVPPGDMWHALTGSLMATLTVLGFQTARRPAEGGPYVALMVSKLVSTFVFLVFALDSSAWLVPAACDGFIALTLFVARTLGDRATGRVDFPGRYLRWLGAEQKDVERYHRRIADMPWEARALLRGTVLALSLMAPLLLLGTWGRAARLGDDEFDTLMKRLMLHTSPLVRGAWLLVHSPALTIVAKARVPEHH